MWIQVPRAQMHDGQQPADALYIGYSVVETF